VRLFSFLAAGAATVVVAVLLARGSEPMAPTGDTAVLESYVIQASQGRLLVGPYSRFQWHHPGPVYFYALVPFYAAAGQRTTGLSAGAFVINVLSILLVLMTLVQERVPGLLLATATMVALYVFRLADLLTSPWNPHVIVVPLLALAVLSAGAASGRFRLLPVVAGLASFVAQTDVGVVPVALVFGAAAVGACLVIAILDRSSRGAFLSATAVTGAVLAVMWLPVLLEQLRNTPGNIHELWRFFAHGREGGGQSLKVAFAAWTDMLAGPLGPRLYLAHGWALRRSHEALTQGWAIVQMASLGLAAVVSSIERRPFPAFLSLLLLLTSAVALWSITRIDGEIMDHQIFWLSGIGALNTAVVAGILVERMWSRERTAGIVPPIIVSGALVVIIVAVGLSRLQVARTASRSPQHDAVAIEQSASAIQGYLARRQIERPLIKIDEASWSLAAGVLLQLQKRGVAYAVDDAWIPMFTDMARTTGREGAILLVAGAAQHVVLKGEPGVVTIAENDPVFVDALAAPKPL